MKTKKNIIYVYRTKFQLFFFLNLILIQKEYICIHVRLHTEHFLTVFLFLYFVT